MSRTAMSYEHMTHVFNCRPINEYNGWTYAISIVQKKNGEALAFNLLLRFLLSLNSLQVGLCRLFLHAIRWRKKCFVIVYWSNLSEKINRLDWKFVKMIGFEPSRIYQNLFLAFISLKLFSQNSLKSLKSTATLLLPSPSPSPAICWHFSFLG